MTTAAPSQSAALISLPFREMPHGYLPQQKPYRAEAVLARRQSCQVALIAKPSGQPLIYRIALSTSPKAWRVIDARDLAGRAPVNLTGYHAAISERAWRQAASAIARSLSGLDIAGL